MHAQYIIWLLSALHQKLQPKTTKTILFYFFIFAKPQGIYSFRTKQPRKRISQIKLKQKVYNKRNNKLFISTLPKKIKNKNFWASKIFPPTHNIPTSGPPKLDFICSSLTNQICLSNKKQTGPSVLSIPISSQTSQK